MRACVCACYCYFSVKICWILMRARCRFVFVRFPVLCSRPTPCRRPWRPLGSARRVGAHDVMMSHNIHRAHDVMTSHNIPRAHATSNNIHRAHATSNNAHRSHVLSSLRLRFVAEAYCLSIYLTSSSRALELAPANYLFGL